MSVDPTSMPQSLLNPLATAAQYYEFTQSQLQQQQHYLNLGLPPNTQIVLSSCAVQLTGTILEIEQDTISTALVVFHRYLVIKSDLHQQPSSLAVAAIAGLFIACKKSVRTVKLALDPVSLLATFNHVQNNLGELMKGNQSLLDALKQNQKNYGSETASIGSVTLPQLYEAEMEVLAAQSFDTRVVLPYSLALSYVQVLRLIPNPASTNDSPNANDASTFGQVVWSIITDAIIGTSPTLVVVHQPHTIAAAAIYLAAVRLGVSISDNGQEWWKVFDVNSQDFGHCLVLIMDGLNGLQKLRS